MKLSYYSYGKLEVPLRRTITRRMNKFCHVDIYLKSPFNIAKAGKAIFQFIGDTDKKVKTWPVSDLLAWYCVCYTK